MVELHNETIFIGEKEKQTETNFVQVRNELLLFKILRSWGFYLSIDLALDLDEYNLFLLLLSTAS